MIHVVASIGVKPGKREEYIELFQENVPQVLAEAGCVEYVPTIDADTKIEAQWTDETVVTVLEKWESLEALNAHLASAHMVQFFEETEDLVDDMSITILENA